MAGKGDITEGGCHCGAVRFRIEGALDRVIVCHCRDCLKTHGNSLASTAVLHRQIAITGDALRWYASSDNGERGFCSACGASMFFRRPGGRGVSIAAGMLDDPAVLEFGGHIYLHDHPGFQPLEAKPVDLHDEYLEGGRKLPEED